MKQNLIMMSIAFVLMAFVLFWGGMSLIELPAYVEPYIVLILSLLISMVCTTRFYEDHPHGFWWMSASGLISAWMLYFMAEKFRLEHTVDCFYWEINGQLLCSALVVLCSCLFIQLAKRI